MKIHMLSFALVFGFAANSWADTVEYCPSPSAISQHAGVYTAPTQAGKGEWLGVVSSAKPGAVKSFDRGAFYAAEDHEADKGFINKCSYVTESNDVLDMRYRPGEKEDIPVKLQNASNWERYESAFGLIAYECTNKADAACAFAEIN